MAIPLIAAALTALLAGGALQYRAASRRDSASAAAMANYGRKTRALSDEATALFEQRLGEQNVEQQQQSIDDLAARKVDRVENLSDEVAPSFNPLLPGTERAPKVVKEAAAQSLAESVARARARLQAIAQLEGFSGRTFDRGLQLGQDSALLGNLAIFDRGNRGVLDSEMRAASMKGQRTQLAGDLLTAVGQIMLAVNGLGGAGSVVNAGTTQGTALADAVNKARYLPQVGLG